MVSPLGSALVLQRALFQVLAGWSRRVAPRRHASVWAAAAVLLAGVLAGCVAGPPNGDAPERVIEYFYACGDGLSAAPCPLDVDDGSPLHYEPLAASDPARPGVAAVAVTRSGEPPGAAAGPPDGSTANRCRVEVHVTQDGGSAWTAAASIPLPPLGEVAGRPVHDRCVRAPSLVFDDEGTLHLVVFDIVTTWASWLAYTHGAGDPAGVQETAGLSGVERRVYHVATHDLGRTWGDPIVLHGNGNHAYLGFDASNGLLVATIRDFAGDGFSRSTVAWSLDRGVSWHGTDGALAVPCHLPTRPVTQAGGATFACTDHSAMGEGPLVQLYRFEATTGTLEPAGGHPVPGAQTLFVDLAGDPDGRLVLAWTPTIPGGDVAGEPAVAWADPDGGFSKPFRVLDALQGEMENRDWMRIGIDPHGTVHAMVLVERDYRLEARHVAFDASGRLLHEGLLAQWSPAPDETVPDPDAAPRHLAPPPGYSLHAAFAFWDDGGVLVAPANEANALRAFRIAWETP